LEKNKNSASTILILSAKLLDFFDKVKYGL